jgi:CRP/FNR family transcriptional regulator, anaerobic regulatory protein
MDEDRGRAMAETEDGRGWRGSHEPVSLGLRRAFGDTPQVVERHTVLVRAGEPSPPVLLLASGWASRERVMSDGQRAILGFYLPGDLVGADHLFVKHAPDSVIALTELGCHALGRNELKARLRQDADLTLHLMQRLSEEKWEQDGHIACLERLPASQRITAFLVRMCERLAVRAGGDGATAPFRIALTQQHLADHLGLNVVHANRMLGALRAAGVLQTRNGSGGLIVSDLARLRSMATRPFDRS